MKGEDILHAMQDIKEEYIEEADLDHPRAEKERKIFRIRPAWIISAAAVFFVLVGAYAVMRRPGGASATSNSAEGYAQEAAAEAEEDTANPDEDAGLYTAAKETEEKETEEAAEAVIAEEAADEEGENAIQIENPFIQCGTLDEAQKIAGFSIDVGAIAEMYSEAVTETVIRAVEGEMIEVLYFSGGEELFRVRKGAGTEDISGDYTAYDEEEHMLKDGADVTLLGNDGGFSTAKWTDGKFTYAVLSGENALPREEMGRLVEGLG